MENNRIFKSFKVAELVLRKKFGRVDVAAELELTNWKNDSLENAKLSLELDQKEILADELNKLNKYDASAAFLRFKDKAVVPQKKRHQLRNIITGLAASLFILGFGTFFIHWYLGRNIADILPGRNIAILTLSNGKKVNLDSPNANELLKEDGLALNRTGNGALIYTQLATRQSESSGKEVYNTIETPKAGQYQVHLPDGTKVWLNAQSALTYQTNLARGNDRRVRLRGEAYFEVAKQVRSGNVAVPFIVNTSRQDITVLGTHFNVSSYDDEPLVKTGLLEGSVKVTIPGKGSSVWLKPGEESEIRVNEDKIAIRRIDAEETLAWKNGEFVFHEESLENIMRKIARWYNVEVVFLDDKKREVTFGGSISRFSNLSKVLKMLELTDLASFKIENNKVIVK